MAYLHMTINGNTSFGGYLSIDGGKTDKIEDGVVQELANGKHTFTIYTASDFERINANVNKRARSGSGNKLLNMANDAIMKGAGGESWSFTVTLGETDCAAIDVTTAGKDFTDDPTLEVIALPEEKYREYFEYFEKLRNTPRRNGKQMKWGIGLAAAFAFGLFNAATSGAEVSAMLVMIAGVAVCALLFALGVRKKVRR